MKRDIVKAPRADKSAPTRGWVHQSMSIKQFKCMGYLSCEMSKEMSEVHSLIVGFCRKVRYEGWLLNHTRLPIWSKKNI